MSQSVELINYSIYPNYETYLVSEMIERNVLPTESHIRQAIDHNHEGVLTQLARFALKSIDWEWIKQKHKVS